MGAELNPAQRLHALGQSLWLDSINRVMCRLLAAGPRRPQGRTGDHGQAGHDFPGWPHGAGDVRRPSALRLHRRQRPGAGERQQPRPERRLLVRGPRVRLRRGTAWVAPAAAGSPERSGRALPSMRFMLAALPFLPLPTLRGERVILRGSRDSDVDDRLAHPIDPKEEDNYGSLWRRGWDGRRYHTREDLTAQMRSPDTGLTGSYDWAVEYDGHCVGHAGLSVDSAQHSARYTVGLFVPALRGRGLGREVTRLVLACASNWRCWPAIAVPSSAIWPAVSDTKASAGKPSCTRTAGKTSSLWGCTAPIGQEARSTYRTLARSVSQT